MSPTSEQKRSDTPKRNGDATKDFMSEVIIYNFSLIYMFLRYDRFSSEVNTLVYQHHSDL